MASISQPQIGNGTEEQLLAQWEQDWEVLCQKEKKNRKKKKTKKEKDKKNSTSLI